MLWATMQISQNLRRGRGWDWMRSVKGVRPTEHRHFGRPKLLVALDFVEVAMGAIPAAVAFWPKWTIDP